MENLNETYKFLKTKATDYYSILKYFEKLRNDFEEKLSGNNERREHIFLTNEIENFLINKIKFNLAIRGILDGNFHSFYESDIETIIKYGPKDLNENVNFNIVNMAKGIIFTHYRGLATTQYNLYFVDKMSKKFYLDKLNNGFKNQISFEQIKLSYEEIMVEALYIINVFLKFVLKDQMQKLDYFIEECIANGLNIYKHALLALRERFINSPYFIDKEDILIEILG